MTRRWSAASGACQQSTEPCSSSNYLGLTIGEVSESLQVAPGTVGSRLHYAMRSLRASLESEARSTEAIERSR